MFKLLVFNECFELVCYFGFGFIFIIYMARTREDFFRDFDELVQDQNIPFLPELEIHSTIVTPQDVITIINGVRNSDREHLNRIGIAREYFYRVFNHFVSKYNDMQSWTFYYPEDDEEGELRFAAEGRMRPLLQQLVNDLNNQRLSHLLGFITNDEFIGLRSVARQKPANTVRKIPVEIERNIGEFVGRTPRGGRKRKTRKRATKKRRKRFTKKYKK